MRPPAQAVCPTCMTSESVTVDMQNGNELCVSCGLVLQARIISEEQEWRSFSNTDGGSGVDRNRTGGKNDDWFEEVNEGTSIIGGDNKMMRAHEAATSVQGKDRLLKQAFANLVRIKNSFRLKDVVMERCKELTKIWLESEQQVKGRTSEKDMLAVVYLVCREAKAARTLRDLTDPYPHVSVADLGRAVNRLKKALVIAKEQANGAPVLGTASGSIGNFGGTTVDAAADLVGRYASVLLGGLDRKKSTAVQTLAETISMKASERLAKGYRPSSLAAACILLSMQLSGLDTRNEYNVAMVAQTAKTSEGTVRGCYKELRSLLPHIVPPEILAANQQQQHQLQAVHHQPQFSHNINTGGDSSISMNGDRHYQF